MVSLSHEVDRILRPSRQTSAVIHEILGFVRFASQSSRFNPIDTEGTGPSMTVMIGMTGYRHRGGAKKQYGLGPCVPPTSGICVASCPGNVNDYTPSRESTNVSNQRNVRPIGSLVNQLMSRRGYAQALANDHLHRVIASAVGHPLDTSFQVGKLSAGVLHIYATDSVTLQELNFQKRSILRLLQAEVPDSKITDLRFRVQT